jgi:prefoldin subunit 5
MQPLQEGVKKDFIKHSFRNIEIVYEAGKTTLTKQDEELLAAYINLHDFELGMKNTASALLQEAKPINEAIEALHADLKKVQAAFDTCNTLADKLSADTYISEETSLKKLGDASEQTGNELKEYNKKILKIYEKVKVLQEKITEYHKDSEERSEALYDKCSALAMAHLKNWEKNSINAAEFDDQYDKFIDYRGLTESHRESLIDACTGTITNNANLNEQTSILYNVWKEFTKRCNLLIIVSELHNNAIGFTAN